MHPQHSIRRWNWIRNTSTRRLSTILLQFTVINVKLYADWEQIKCTRKKEKKLWILEARIRLEKLAITTRDSPTPYMYRYTSYTTELHRHPSILLMLRATHSGPSYPWPIMYSIVRYHAVHYRAERWNRMQPEFCQAKIRTESLGSPGSVLCVSAIWKKKNTGPKYTKINK